MKDLDIVLFGASGFTGRLVADYLKLHGQRARWAIAGRNRAKLETVEAGVPILIADADDPASLRAITERTRVVCTTVGPYAQHGTPLVEACVEAGIGYCDLTGEPHWIRDIIRRFHPRAEQTGARIVHCCGFDSIPSDLGTFMIADWLEQRHHRKLKKVRLRTVRMRGAMSGGTIHSALGVLEAMRRDPELRRTLQDPYCFDPEDSRRGPDKPERVLPQLDRERGRWLGLFGMSYVNARVVRRSNALMHHRYGDSFSYEEVMDAGRGTKGLSRALGVSLGLGAMAATALLGGGDLLKRFLPSPGEGPSREARERGSFAMELDAESEGAPPIRMKGTVAAEGDPGYAATARMLGESALCLALDNVPARGVLTPAVAMGPALLERLRRAGMTFDVREV